MELEKIEQNWFFEGEQYLCSLFDAHESVYLWVVLVAKNPECGASNKLGYNNLNDELAVDLNLCGHIYKLPAVRFNEIV